MTYTPQVSKDHYTRGSYRVRDRWNSYWHQLEHVRAFKPESVLEIGVGDKTVSEALVKDRISVTTADIDENLHPDVVAPVTELPFEDGSFDVVLAAEVLEHIRFEDVPKALSELRRVARRGVVVGLPHSGWVFAFEWKVPLVPRISMCFKIPHFWKTHEFNGEHYWELGKRGFSTRKFVQVAGSVGLTCVVRKKYADDPAHVFLRFRKQL